MKFINIFSYYLRFYVETWKNVSEKLATVSLSRSQYFDICDK